MPSKLDQWRKEAEQQSEAAQILLDQLRSPTITKAGDVDEWNAAMAALTANIRRGSLLTAALNRAHLAQTVVDVLSDVEERYPPDFRYRSREKNDRIRTAAVAAAKGDWSDLNSFLEDELASRIRDLGQAASSTPSNPGSGGRSVTSPIKQPVSSEPASAVSSG